MSSDPNPGLAVRKSADRFLAATADAVDDFLGSDQFSKGLARGMTLTAGALAATRKVTRAVGGVAASWFNIPSRKQVVDLSRRIVHLELVIDDIDARTAAMLEQSREAEDDR